jgi:hypothetical protein
MQDEQDRTTPDMVPIEHIPIAPPRKGHEGEQAYLDLWKRFMARCDEDALESMFSATAYRRLATQRQASVAASFVLWLGTNCGTAMLRTAQDSMTTGGYRNDPSCRYLRQWELENRRAMFINGGLRCVEAILTPERSGGGQLTLHNVPTVTVDDLDVIDCICMWLATQDGQHFIKAADAQITALQRARYLFGEETGAAA